MNPIEAKIRFMKDLIKRRISCTYIETPVHLDYIWMVESDERLPLSEYLLLFARLHDLPLLNHLDRIKLP